MMRRLRKAIAKMLNAGAIPEHIAFIMDGNRRFADRACSGNVAMGHDRGFGKLLDALEWCSELGIKCVTVYAFSIDNFKRSPSEVDALMRLAEIRLYEMLKDDAIAQRFGVQIRVIGKLDLLPEAVQQAARKAMEKTKHHDRVVLNICLAYSSTLEMGCALRKAQKAVGGKDWEGKIAISHFERSLQTEGCPPVSLLVRTSGECRLSDFLLWQSSRAVLHFTPVLWPDFSFLHLLQAVVSYQRSVALPKGRQPEQEAEQITGHIPCKADGAVSVTSRENEKPAMSRSEAPSAASPTRLQDSEDEGELPSRSILGEVLSKEEQEASHARQSAASCAEVDFTPQHLPSNEKWRQRLQNRAVYLIAADGHGGGLSQPAVAALDDPAGLDSRDNGKAASCGSLEQPGQKEDGLRTRGVDSDERQLAEDIQQRCALSQGSLIAPPRRHGVTALDRRKRGGSQASLPQADELDSLGGYDSMDEDEEDTDDLHVNGCPCCIVRFLPMHRICTDPVPAIAALREESRGD